MAHKTANLICPKCGKEFTKEFYDSGSGAYKRLEQKIEWAESKASFLCSDCYKQECREAVKEMGLVAELKVGLFFPNGISIVFKGDTYPHKDKLKELGCKWTDEYPDDFLGVDRPQKAWVYSTTVDNAEDVCEVIVKSGAKFKMPSNMDKAILQAFKKFNDEQRTSQSQQS